MKINLDTMREEIQEYLDSHGLAVFHGFPRGSEQTPAVYWNAQEHPDYRKFLEAAAAAGVKLVNLYANEFSEDSIEDAMERLESSVLPGDERRAIEARLKEMRAYVGFVCQIELSFDLAPRVYIFDLHTDWFDDLTEILDRIDDAYEDTDDEEPLSGGYFSKN
jgi:hypothetical protein